MMLGRRKAKQAPQSDDPGTKVVSAEEARKRIAAGRETAGLVVRETLRWEQRVDGLRLPEGLSCYELDVQGQPITVLPAGLSVGFRLVLRNCTHLESLPDGLTVGSLDVSGCTALRGLPEGLNVYFLDISGCPQLRGWPQAGRLDFGRLRAWGCTGLTELPPWIRRLSQLDLRDCANLRSLPNDLRVSSWIDVAGTGLRALPPTWAQVALRWRGVPVDARTAFRPEEITAAEVLAEPNAELRRVKLERMGFERFLREADADVLDEDRDAGGPRRLLRVPLENDEPLVCVSVHCPSTTRHYLIRVPPDMQTCRQAVAWTAGFDDPDDYRPLVET